MRKLSFGQALLVSLFLFQGSAIAATTIDFEGVVADDAYQLIDGGYSEDGFLLKDSVMQESLSIQGKDSNNWPYSSAAFDSAYMAWCGKDWSDFGGPDCLGNPLELTHSTSVFSLVSADFSAGSGEGGAYMMLINGRSSAGQDFYKEVEVSAGQLTTVEFGSEWSNLTYVRFRADGTEDCFQQNDPAECGGAIVYDDEFNGAVDNIVVNAVPLPAAVWLFGSALAGLGWMRRKQTA